MKNFDVALKNYERGLWTDDMLSKLVAKGKIKSAEYEEITGEPYPEDGEVSAEEALTELMEVME